MTFGNINWKRGFNRLYLVAAIGWIGYVLVFLPIQLSTEQDLALQRDLEDCLSKSAATPTRLAANCYAADAFARQHLQEPNRWNIDPSHWLNLIGLAVVPPYLGYWLLRALGLLSKWILRGLEPEN